jgi:hypothetical protein
LSLVALSASPHRVDFEGPSSVSGIPERETEIRRTPASSVAIDLSCSCSCNLDAADSSRIDDDDFSSACCLNREFSSESDNNCVDNDFAFLIDRSILQVGLSKLMK